MFANDLEDLRPLFCCTWFSCCIHDVETLCITPVGLVGSVNVIFCAMNIRINVHLEGLKQLQYHLVQKLSQENFNPI